MEVKEFPFTELLSKIVDNRGRTCPRACPKPNRGRLGRRLSGATRNSHPVLLWAAPMRKSCRLRGSPSDAPDLPPGC